MTACLPWQQGHINRLLFLVIPRPQKISQNIGTFQGLSSTPLFWPFTLKLLQSLSIFQRLLKWRIQWFGSDGKNYFLTDTVNMNSQICKQSYLKYVKYQDSRKNCGIVANTITVETVFFFIQMNENVIMFEKFKMIGKNSFALLQNSKFSSPPP